MNLLRKILAWPFKALFLVLCMSGFVCLIAYAVILGKLDQLDGLLDHLIKAVEEFK